MFDSLNSENNYKSLRSALSIIQKQPGRIELYTVNMQNQEGDCDCGLFAISCAIELCKGNNPASISFSQKELRDHYQSCLNAQQMSSFPQSPRNEPLNYQTRRLNRK